MRSKIGWLVLLLGILLGMGTLILAQTPACDTMCYGVDDQGNPNSPRLNERANACYTNGTLGGTCTTRAAWEIGWYLIRVQSGNWTCAQVPSHYRSEVAKQVNCNTATPTPAKANIVTTEEAK